MSNNRRVGSTLPAFLRLKSRLYAESPLSIASILVPFASVAVLTIYLGLETSTRLRAVAQPFIYSAKMSPDRGIWLSLAIHDGGLRILTEDGETISWKGIEPSKMEYQEFEDFLKQKSRNLALRIVRSGQIRENQTAAIISVDQSLTYQHIRPIVYALAASGFSKYGFETRIIK